MSHYQGEYERLRSRMDQTMQNLNAAQSAARSFKAHSPLRQSLSRSPKGREGLSLRPMPYTEKQPTRRSYQIDGTAEKERSPLRQKQDLDYEPVN